MKFAEFDLRPELLQAIEAAGFTEPTPIQEVVIPQVLKGKDVSGLAQTGTGKTAAFVVPLIDRILRHRAGETGERVPANWKKNSFVLVLVPTRELAVQVEENIGLLGKAMNIRGVVIVGGSAYDDQRKGLREGVEFVVGTPGRLLDLYKSHDLDLNSVGAIVFDEADRMFDMGFKDDMRYILRRVPRDRQFLLFSATLNFEVLNTAYEFGAEPVEFNVSRDQATAEGIDHSILHVGQDEKPMYLLSVLKKQAPQQCIVFSNFKYNVGHIARFLKNNGIEAIEMSSLLSQHQRNKVLEQFKLGKQQILVATDVAARGLDVKGIDLVVNYDLPDDAEGYVHRIGRTGRAGGSGHAIGLVSDRDVEALMRIETYLKDKIKVGWFEDAELLRDFKPFTRDDGTRENKGPRPSRPSGSGSGSGPRRPDHRPNNRQSQGGQGPGARGPNNNNGPQRSSSPTSRGPAPARGHNQNSRPQNSSNTKPQNPVGHGQAAGSGSDALSPQHRDRKLGRHGGIGNAATGGNGNNRPSQGQHRGSRHNPNSPNRNASQGQPQRRPLRNDRNAPRSAAKSPTSGSGVGEKIKGFFSKLFK